MTFRYVFLGRSLRSSWNNAHATTYRALLRALAARGHEVVFLERDDATRARTADLLAPSWASLHVYGTLPELFETQAPRVRDADLVVLGSGVPDGIEVARWALGLTPSRIAFYDLDTPVTLDTLVEGTCSWLRPDMIECFPLYLSSAGGPTLDILRRTYDAPWVRPLPCSVDPAVHFPERSAARWDLGYLGSCTDDRRAGLERLLVEPARLWTEGRFAVAGPRTEDELAWPQNVDRADHVAPSHHRSFYGAQRFALNVSRRASAAAGWAPSVRLFEAAACATPVITDLWPGLDELLVPGTEVLVVRTAAEVLRLLRELPEAHRIELGEAARRRILAEHTAEHRAETLERYTRELLERRPRRSRSTIPEVVDRGEEP